MATILQTSQQIQIESFWNLIQASDENVQRELLRLLNSKYASLQKLHKRENNSFFNLKGILRSQGDAVIDQKMIDDYLKDKYDL